MSTEPKPQTLIEMVSRLADARRRGRAEGLVMLATMRGRAQIEDLKQQQLAKNLHESADRAARMTRCRQAQAYYRAQYWPAALGYRRMNAGFYLQIKRGIARTHT